MLYKIEGNLCGLVIYQWSSDLWNVTCTLDLAHPYPTSFSLTTLPATRGCMPGDINSVHLHTLPYFKKRKSVFALISTRDQTKIMYCVIDRFLCLQL